MYRGKLSDSNFREQVKSEVLPLVKSIRQLEKRLEEHWGYTGAFGTIVMPEQVRICSSLKTKWLFLIDTLRNYDADEKAISELGIYKILETLDDVTESPYKSMKVKSGLMHENKWRSKKTPKLEEYRDDLSIKCLEKLMGHIGIELDEVETEQPAKSLEKQSEELYEEGANNASVGKDAIGYMDMGGGKVIKFEQKDENPIDRTFALEFASALFATTSSESVEGSQLKETFNKYAPKTLKADLDKDTFELAKDLYDDVVRLDSKFVVKRSDTMMTKIIDFAQRLRAYGVER